MVARAVKLDATAPNPRDFALDFILFEHAKHRQMCAALERLAEADTFGEGEIAERADFIRTDLAAHIADEEEALFPILQQRCDEEDHIAATLARLDREHEVDRDLSARVCLFLLEAVATGRPPKTIVGASEALRMFAYNQLLHMSLENAVLIPLARRRLSPTDLSDLGGRLAARRSSSRGNG